MEKVAVPPESESVHVQHPREEHAREADVHRDEVVLPHQPYLFISYGTLHAAEGTFKAERAGC